MTKRTVWKKTVISSLAVMMLAGGASSAFANGDGGRKGDDRDDKKQEKEVKVNWKFKDEDDMKWAMEYIMRLASKGVFTGYEDGTFKPHQKISRIETLVAAVRLMGLREQAESTEEMSTKLNFKDADLLAKKYPWAVGYVAVAVENDLFSETETAVNPQANATRLWAATILVKALKLEDEAKALNNTQLDFKDAKNIPAGSVGYVALAIKKGIITGYNDNTFRPNQPVSRAELAALLDRTDSEIPDNDGQAITGKLKAVASNGQITITQSNGTDLTLGLDSSVFIFRDDKKVAVSALKAGDELLVRTYQNKVVFIEVTKKVVDESKVFDVTGKINTITYNSNGKLSTISISKPDGNQTTVTIYNVADNVLIAGDRDDLVMGHEVRVQGKDGVIAGITII
ncbi:S-layer homology domain-containing protein [Paenibacillus glycanilyticus]|uniref:S-layer homology domain-containing protein n=1 Tax=Paenibacillus glycanilyticus TaxID=126569 RepID=UPI00203DCDEC|nr:S-layer homology domain-containing protein [Paenibacillus glycanilyticus]MCM3628996.1 S-layer homology domain-containing protein [Paenibacillus glycanilyticus]